MFRGMTVAALVALAWTGDARAAAPQVDPAAPPAITVEAGMWAHQGLHPADGDTFTVSRGAWTGAGNTYSYQWQRCSSSSCSDIAGATAPSLKADSLYGSGLRAAVTATNADGSTTVHSATTRPLADELAHRIDPAVGGTIQGVTEEGSTLTLAAEGLYAGSRPLRLEVTWQRCTDSGDCRDITATPGTYVPVPADVGHRIRALFSVVNGAGHSTAHVAPAVGPVQANTRPPSVVAAPSLTAPEELLEGDLLVAAPGTWSGGQPIAFAYQWLRCDGDACTEIEGETISRYAAGGADVDRRLRVRVTASSPYGEQTALSDASALVKAAPPSPADPPTVSGTARDRQILAGTRGTFTGSGPIEEVPGWERCDAEGAACTVIAGATADAYTLVPADIGHRLRFRVTATNAGGSAVARSAPTPVVQAIAPAAHVLPAVSGIARDEQVLEGTLGEWVGSPEIVYARQWMRCSDAGCSPVAGATGATYELTAADVGSRLRLRVTATNFGNREEALSPPTDVVVPSAPRAVEPPSLSGTARDGAVLSASPGGWKGTAPLAHAYRWERCDGACAAIAAATEASYRLTSEDVGRRVRVVVTAAGPGGTAEAASVASELVAAVAPQVDAAPELAGPARDGEVLTASPATWTGSVPIRTLRRWERCDPDCAPIAGAEGDTYALTPADVGARVRVVERAANAGGQAEAASPLTPAVAPRAPGAVEPPVIAGVPRDGETLEGSRGTWEGTPELAMARQWLRCSSAGDLGGCEAVPAADRASHRVSGDDVGSFLRLRLTATNAAGSATAHSEAVGPVAAAAPAAVPGEGPFLTIPGDPDPSAPDVGDRVVVEPGRWAGTARETTFAYRWERCDTSGCREVAGRTGVAETVTADDAGKQLRVVVTATNTAGTASQATPRLGVTRDAAPVLAAAPAATAPAPAEALPLSAALAPQACQVVTSRRTLRAGGVKLTVRPGTASAAQPLPVRLTGRARRVTLRAGARRVPLRRAGRGRMVAALRPAVLAKAQLLQLAVVPHRGRPAKASARLAVKPCQALLSVRLRGRRLALRVDQRAPIGRVTFTLPKRLAIRPATAKAPSQITLAGRRLTLPALPPRTTTAALTVQLAGKPRRGRALRFAAVTDSARIKATASVRR